LLTELFHAFGKTVSSNFSQPITSAAVPQKKAASAFFNSSVVIVFSSTSISNS